MKERDYPPELLLQRVLVLADLLTHETRKVRFVSKIRGPETSEHGQNEEERLKGYTQDDKP